MSPLGGMFSWSVGDMGSAMLRNLTDAIAGEELDPGTRPGDVQGKYNQQRSDVRGKASDIGFDGTFHPQAVLDEDMFERENVEELRRRVDAIDLTRVGELIATWQGIHDRANESLQTYSDSIKRLTEDGLWAGASGAAAVEASKTYTTHGSQLANAALLTSNKLAELKTGLEPTKLLVPHAPEDRSLIENSRSWMAGRGWRSNTEAEDTAKLEAVRVLKTVFAPVVRESDTNVPVLPQPFNPVQQPGDQPSQPGPGPGGPGPGSPGPGPGGTPATEPETPTDPDIEDPSSTDPSQSTPSSTDPSSTPTSTDPSSTNPASTNPASTPTTNPTGPGSPGSPGPGSPGAPGPGSPGGTPSPGRSIQGVPVSAPTGAPAGAANSAAARGMSGLGGFGAPGARGGKGDEESNKGIPDYLITKEHGDEVTGLDDLPKTVPPVIGE
ncbi:hypothetical protein IU433_15380 [Nocardia puris]|nr:hypothetical protein [Nocardia puris]MBF6214526.1 hypothetical protein [Nocardia puris]MBF6365935.1 hypothetical protein [Nocardia puris]MBF6460422.1 hypothetical protein [Nocardia puris]